MTSNLHDFIVLMLKRADQLSDAIIALFTLFSCIQFKAISTPTGSNVYTDYLSVVLFIIAISY